MIHHAAGDHIPAGQFFFRRLIIGHEAVQILIQQVAAVPAAAFGDQNLGWHDAGGMELHRLHIAQRHDPGVQRNGHAGAFVDDGVGGGAVYPTVATGGDDRGLGQIDA